MAYLAAWITPRIRESRPRFCNLRDSLARLIRKAGQLEMGQPVFRSILYKITRTKSDFNLGIGNTVKEIRI